MTAVTYDIVIEQGATFTFNLTWKDSLGAPINLSGYTARMQVRKSVKDTAKMLDLTVANGAITLGGALGTIAIVASATLTSAMDSVKGVYDIEVESATGVVTRLAEGEVTIKLEVTR